MFLTQASLRWQDHTAWSDDYADVYFSRSGGLAEARHVFLAGNRLAERFRDSNGFCIGELGFGCGLNFLATWQCWEEFAPAHARLHYYAAELSPLSLADLRDSLQHFAELAELAAELIRHYPQPIPGYHRILLGQGRVSLTLMLGDALTQLQQLEGRMDAWFLDGFSPRKNPRLWQQDLFSLLAEKTAQAGTLATYSVAGEVRSRLQNAGFVLSKRPGFAEKHQMLSGQLDRKAGLAQRSGFRPWFHPPRSATPPTEPVAVIGGGLAGTACARSLALRGINSVILETGPAPAQGASGNSAGLVMPFLTADHGLASRVYLESYRYSLQVYSHLSAGQTGLHGLRGGLGPDAGVVRLADSPARSKAHRRLLDLWQAPPGVAPLVMEGEPNSPAWTSHGPNLFYPQGGWLDPRSVCHAHLQAAQPFAELRCNQPITSLERKDGRWLCLDEQGAVRHSAATVILAQGAGLKGLPQSSGLSLAVTGGRITLLPATDTSRHWRKAVCFKGYLLPAQAGFHTLGATYRIGAANPASSREEHEENLQRLQSACPAHFPAVAPDALLGRGAFRVTTPDHLPVVGAVPDWAWYAQAYATLQRGFPADSYPSGHYWPGLYLSGGHGSRGLISTLLAAEMVASQIANEPAPVEIALLEALHPARFLIRKLFAGKADERLVARQRWQAGLRERC